jgi:hypothetical protein
MFRRPFEASKCIGGAGDEQPAEQCLNQSTPPSRRELECSVERHAAAIRSERPHLNDLVVPHAKR